MTADVETVAAVVEIVLLDVVVAMESFYLGRSLSTLMLEGVLPLVVMIKSICGFLPGNDMRTS